MAMIKVTKKTKILWVLTEIFEDVSDMILLGILLQRAHREPTSTSKVITSGTKAILLERVNFRLRSFGFKTVSRELWMEEYLSTLLDELIKIVASNNTGSMSDFGDEKELNAIPNVVTLVVIGTKQFLMLVDIVKNIPLLIS